MAGSLYLGSQRVCPAVIVGGGSDINVGLEVDQDGKLISQQTGSVVFSGFSDVWNGIFSFRFSGNSITSADLSNLTDISGSRACESMFFGCSSLTSMDLSNLTTISGFMACDSMFYSCTSLTSADLSNLTTISNDQACYAMFSNCQSLTSVDLSNLTTISGYVACGAMFSNCPLLTSLSFPSLKTIYTNAFSGLLYNCSGVTIHFPSNMESTISGLKGYPNFGGTNITLLFDLPPTA